MPLILKILAVYLLAANMVAFVAFGIDKRKARKGRWRTPERTLMTMAAVGGALGAWLGMKAFHPQDAAQEVPLRRPRTAHRMAGAAGMADIQSAFRIKIRNKQQARHGEK